MWNPSLYLKFADQRQRPCIDLVCRIAHADPQRIIDLGCGPGNSTAVLRAQWPQAQLTGVDNSPAMLEQARQGDNEVEWIEADIGAWRPADPGDLLFSNAALQWVPNHRAVLPSLLRCLRKPGLLAVQIPFHLRSPAHLAIEELCAEKPWKNWLHPAPHPFEILDLAQYYRLLRPLAQKLDLWQATYCHILERPTTIVEWMRGTGLRPYLDRIPPAEHARFLAAYQQKVDRAFPVQPDGRVLFPFPRLFFVAEV